ncbi:MAG: pilus assembly protein [Candidatus Aenigmarchaeota archaeon]|nr:pilus assembly protein [Candidatus Aenigmarchaeota archaeon]MDI6723004.1 pilus assembly protein [Candidatus Aenigmarchaeota archaeon]
MIYAESDFFLAMIKGSDWLKRNAVQFEIRNKGNLITSVITVAEILLAGKKYNLDPEIIVSSIFEISKVEGMTAEEGMEAAHLIKNEGFGVFDAFHAVLSRDMPIVSSEQMYDKIGKERIKLEQMH